MKKDTLFNLAPNDKFILNKTSYTFKRVFYTGLPRVGGTLIAVVIRSDGVEQWFTRSFDVMKLEKGD